MSAIPSRPMGACGPMDRDCLVSAQEVRMQSSAVVVEEG
jgi:hypothetical protein